MGWPVYNSEAQNEPRAFCGTRAKNFIFRAKGHKAKAVDTAAGD
jgi:hypothetical protein